MRWDQDEACIGLLKGFRANVRKKSSGTLTNLGLIARSHMTRWAY